MIWLLPAYFAVNVILHPLFVNELKVLVAQHLNVGTDFYSLKLCLGKQFLKEHANITLFELFVFVNDDLKIFFQHLSEQRDRRHIP